MFIEIEYLDEWDLLNRKYISKTISIFAIISVATAKSGCKILVAGFQGEFQLKETKEEFEARCTEKYKSMQPVTEVFIPAPAPIAEPPIADEPPKAPIFSPLILELEEKQDDNAPI